MPTEPSAAPTPATWDPQQYLRHAGHRTRPFLDLLARIRELPGENAETDKAIRIADLGCGAGNVTALLADRWPTARITGFDNSPEMLATARREHAGPTPGGGAIDFHLGDARDWTPAPASYDLIVSNALLHWVPDHAAAFPRWIDGLIPGGTFAFQAPGNFGAPSHTLLAELCASPRWHDRLAGARERAAVLEPTDYLAHLVDLRCTADVWETTYAQLLPGDDPVLDWLKGTTLRPALTALADDSAALEEFLDEYRELLRAAYPRGSHGTVYPFRRLFAIAHKTPWPAGRSHP
ncbi:trans-aconitate 2-methyltransferase [Streptomyces albipurpureus]|uniref:Trans-aconitate 2-methyltransferase n=1 Tax=Streptomyces albipurpureus TaxID=2897419 RepID=A0ABT0UMW7_9ACTN|nr:trans-aconitate 2-methyltransferase [Streptomyces sp. CWNU-1]MCM2389968.1 trans-aconitate 2-methyltransferase [Streptomyces sp. CWNU-1]